MKNEGIFTIIKIMRICFRVWIVSTIFLNTVWASDGSAQKVQNVYKVDVQIGFKKADIKTILKKIEEKTDFRFAFDQAILSSKEYLNLERSSYSLGELLEIIGQKFYLNFRQVNENIDVKKVTKGKPKVTTQVSIDLTVNGTVSDENNDPIPGATILVKGTTTGTISDIEGQYSIEAQEDATLVISYVGYLLQEIPVNGRSVIDISLRLDIRSLQEVIVIGYGSVQKSDITGAVSSLKGDDLNKGANASVDQLISGRASGVMVTQTSSEPGGGMSIRIRGASSINAQNEPLYVIDGVAMDNSSLLSASSADATSSENGAAFLSINVNPKNPLNSLNPNDIESIEILKDASATAIYGSRGANGVVLITTKKGSMGKARVNYDFYSGVQTVAKKLDVLSPSEYIDVINGISEDSGNGPVFSSSDINSIGAGTDWQDEIFEDAFLQSHNVSVSGGANKTSYYTSLNYFDQEGVLKNTGIKKYIGRVKVSHDISEKISVGFSVNTSLIKDNNSIDGLNINEEAGPVNAAFLYDPTEPVKNADGSFFRSPNLTLNNPVSLVEGVSSSSETNRTFANVTFDYEIIKDLKAKVNFSSDRQNNTRNIYNSRLTIHGESNGGAANISTLELSNVLTEFTLAYSKDIRFWGNPFKCRKNGKHGRRITYQFYQP